MERLISLAGEGKLKPVIDRELPLEQAADAHRADPSAGDLREGHPATLGAWGSETLSVSQNWFIKLDPPQTRLRRAIRD
jgi:Zinc-binding dehydrogenase